MKMVMVVYNEAIDVELLQAMAACGLQNFSRVTQVSGRGNASGTHEGNDIWPGMNNILYVACPDDKAQALMQAVRALRNQLGAEGVKAFMWTIDEMT